MLNKRQQRIQRYGPEIGITVEMDGNGQIIYRLTEPGTPDAWISEDEAYISVQLRARTDYIRRQLFLE